eukprot:SAG25_NODE_12706_length_276_cov_0.655367_1_plen_49_part_01
MCSSEPALYLLLTYNIAAAVSLPPPTSSCFDKDFKLRFGRAAARIAASS